MKRTLILTTTLLLFLLVFLYFGRSLYKPYLNQITGKETVESRIEQIQENVWSRLKDDLNSAGYTTDYPKEIILVAFKKEKLLQVYANGRNGFKMIKEYPFTAFSGKLGPKLKEGDRQIPEGVYHVEYLNPNSTYYLSIKVSYPNELDKSKTKLTNISDLGGDIFIHGKAATIGCIPIGDKAIEEVFLLTHKAINNGVKVIIAPWDFRTKPNHPEIEEIEWENELYDSIRKELKTLPYNNE